MNAFQNFLKEAKFDATESKFFEDNFEKLVSDYDFLKQCQEIYRNPAFQKIIEQVIRTLWMSTNKENYDLIAQSAEAVDGIYLFVKQCADEFKEREAPKKEDDDESFEFDSPPTGDLNE